MSTKYKPSQNILTTLGSIATLTQVRKMLSGKGKPGAFVKQPKGKIATALEYKKAYIEIEGDNQGQETFGDDWYAV